MGIGHGYAVAAAVKIFNLIFKAYSSCVKRVYGLPLTTFTYLVEGHLASHQPPLRNMELVRYPCFYQRPLTEQEGWRLGLLDRLLMERSELLQQGADAKRVIAMISSLCTT